MLTAVTAAACKGRPEQLAPSPPGARTAGSLHRHPEEGSPMRVVLAGLDVSKAAGAKLGKAAEPRS